jgi:L-arabinose isomerase
MSKPNAEGAGSMMDSGTGGAGGMTESGMPKIGLLPLMLELYRQYSPEMIEHQRPFIDRIAGKMSEFSTVATAPVSVNRTEVGSSIRKLESEGVELLVVLFIAYATSISALQPLLRTDLPLLLFSTTPKSSMAEGMSMDDIMLNHGVHGYMDLANVLRRNGRSFQFLAGRFDDERAYAKIRGWALAARAKRRLAGSTIGLAGYTFDGMGDFGIDTTHLNAVLGPEVRHVPLNLLSDRIHAVTDRAVREELSSDHVQFEIDPGVSEDIHVESNRVYLGLKKVVEELSLDAFSMHFQGILENPEIRTLPFLAISKLQQQGLAYAGEGDVLGATGNLMSRLLTGDTLFTETFCPDFDGGRIVMGHMGESNPAFGRRTVLRRKKFVFGEVLDPVIADVEMDEGLVTVLNLGMVEDAGFQMILYTGDICSKIPGSEDIDMPYFHFRPAIKLEDMLTEYGYLGGTHHIAMTRGDKREDLMKLAQLLDIETEMLL